LRLSIYLFNEAVLIYSLSFRMRYLTSLVGLYYFVNTLTPGGKLGVNFFL